MNRYIHPGDSWSRSKVVSKPASLNSDFTESTTIGRFGSPSIHGETFDEKVQRGYDEFMEKGIDLRTDANVLAKNEAVYEEYKDFMLSDLRDDCENFAAMENAAEGVYYGNNVSLYDQVSTLMDNTRALHEQTLASVGTLLPIKTLDYPILIKNHLSLVAKDILQTEVVQGPIVKKYIEQQYVVSNQDPTKRWRFPQCFYEEEGISELFGEGKGYPIKETPVELPLNGFNIPAELTDCPIPGRESVALDIKIIKLNVKLPVAGVTVEYTLPRSIRVDYSDSHFHGADDIKINVPYETTDDEGNTTTNYEEVTIQLFGKLDPKTNDVIMVDALGTVESVVFAGYLSNELNERSTRIEWEREEREFHIDDGFRQMTSFSLEELQDTKALLGFDLYQRAYKAMADVMSEVEDSTMLNYLDIMYDRLNGIEVEIQDILGWDGFAFEDTFDCDPSQTTTLSPAEWIAQMLKFKIDGIIADMVDMLKCEDYTFVIYGNPRIIRLLDPIINWVKRAGSSTAGVRLNHSYGVLTSQSYSVTVIAAAKVLHHYDSEKLVHKGLRIIPYPTSKERFTMKHYKYTSNIETPQTSAYRDPNRPGGSKTYVMCTSRYMNAEIQPIIVGLDIQNAEKYISTKNK